MTVITHMRMESQHLTGPPLATSEEVVGRLGAIQSQDFGPGKWSIAQRTHRPTQEAVDSALAAGTILRTHILRPTWHFVLAEDIRWLLDLTAPRVQAVNASFYRRQELDTVLLDRCNAALAGALAGGHHLTRAEIAEVLQRAGVVTTPLRTGAILMNAELSGVVCSGAPRGKRQSHASLDERAPGARRLSRDEALAELCLRYFRGHGPATVRDLGWWASLTLTEVQRGLAMVASELEREEFDGVTYWFAPEVTASEPGSPAVHLVQGYDEYIVGYGPTKYLADILGFARSLPRPRGIYTHAVILDGQLAGQWKPMPSKKEIAIEATLFIPFSDSQMESLHAAAARYGQFLGLPATLHAKVVSD